MTPSDLPVSHQVTRYLLNCFEKQKYLPDSSIIYAFVVNSMATGVCPQKL